VSVIFQNGLKESITTTAEHPFYVVENGWVPAGLIDEGAVIVGTEADSRVSITDIKINQKPQFAYNLTVKIFRTSINF